MTYQQLEGDGNHPRREPARAVLSEGRRFGALSRRLEVVLLEISGSGCLIEAPIELQAGTLATLSVELGGIEYSDPVRIARSQPLLGKGDRCRMGAEFAWLTAPGEGSLRALAARIESGEADAVSEP